jgi:hypothetical protein
MKRQTNLVGSVTHGRTYCLLCSLGICVERWRTQKFIVIISVVFCDCFQKGVAASTAVPFK